MPRQKRHDKINSFHLAAIERQVSLLKICLTDAQRSLSPFEAHYNAISSLADQLKVMLNLLNDRPADYREPHRGAMSGFL